MKWLEPIFAVVSVLASFAVLVVLGLLLGWSQPVSGWILTAAVVAAIAYFALSATFGSEATSRGWRRLTSRVRPTRKSSDPAQPEPGSSE